jgi:hypothetical protein
MMSNTGEGKLTLVKAARHLGALVASERTIVGWGYVFSKTALNTLNNIIVKIVKIGLLGVFPWAATSECLASHLIIPIPSRPVTRKST